MQPKIVDLAATKLIGLSINMSLAQNKTAQLWGSFGPQIKKISNRLDNNKISLQLYPKDYHADFNLKTEFTKWASVAVTTLDAVPKGLQSLILPAGRYAVFNYKGASTDTTIYTYIFTEWLPQSGYRLDDRPHFEVLGNAYKNNDPNSEEEIWIPIKA